MTKVLALLNWHARTARSLCPSEGWRPGSPGPRAAVALASFVLLMAVMTSATASAEPVTTVPSVDLQRYLGTWFEIARYPNRFQKSCASDVTATYGARDDGRLDVINRCRQTDGSEKVASGVARVVDSTTRAKLKVRFAPAALSFLPFAWGDYWIIGLGPDYSWAVVGTPDRSYLWILSRTTAMSESAWSAAIERVRANGFEPTKLQKTLHMAQ